MLFSRVVVVWFCGVGVVMIEFLLWFRTARWRALVAGAVAGSSMLLTGLEDQHTSLAIYILMRAAVLASRCGIKSKRFGKFFKPLTWKHGDIFLMCLSSSQILYVIMLITLSLFFWLIFTEEIFCHYFFEMAVPVYSFF